VLADSHAEIADTRANVSNNHPRPYANFIERSFGQFLDLTLRPLQPLSPSNPHHGGDSPAGDRVLGLREQGGRGEGCNEKLL
jgi:hypothetical protein